MESSWKEIFELVPAAEHENFLLVTTSQLEINVQTLVRLEGNYVVLRGRLSGMDGNRLLIMPYHEISCLSFVRPVKDDQVRSWYGEAPAAAPAPAAAAPAEEAAQPAASQAEPTPAAPGPAAPAPTPTQMPARGAPLPGKAALLEKLRARTAKPQPPGNP